jgi:hypothetical protein
MRYTGGGRPGVLTLLALFTALVTVFAAGCGGGGGGGGTPGGPTTTVTGLVRDSANNDLPVGGATVVIGGASANTTTVDQASADRPTGSFTVSNASQGASTATVTVNGQSQTVAFSPAVGPGANNIGDLFINIGQIRGIVLLPNGQRAANAFVSVAANGDTTTTGNDGSFLLINVPLGPTRLTLVSGLASLSQDINVGNGVTDVGELRLVQDANILPPDVPKTITGRVVLGGPGGGPAGGTLVALFRNGSQIESTFTASDGTYRFYVPVGTYTIEFRRITFQDASFGPVNVTNPATPLEVAEVTLQPQ